jgi:hypothetical protein
VGSAARPERVALLAASRTAFVVGPTGVEDCHTEVGRAGSSREAPSGSRAAFRSYAR